VLIVCLPVCCVISGFLPGVDESVAVLRYYATSRGNFLPTFRDNLSVPFQGRTVRFGFLTAEDETLRHKLKLGRVLKKWAFFGYTSYNLITLKNFFPFVFEQTNNRQCEDM
jgi:hypothetical protein